MTSLFLRRRRNAGSVSDSALPLLTAAREVAENRRVSKAIIICVLGLSAVLFAAGASAGQAPAPAKPAKNPVASTPQSIAAGKATFQKYCRFCHGAEGKGDGPMAPKDSHPPDLTDAKWEFGSADVDIYQSIAEGVPPKFVMKGFKSRMTATEIWNVVNFIQSLQPKGTR